jgi:hypothetical protein
MGLLAGNAFGLHAYDYEELVIADEVVALAPEKYARCTCVTARFYGGTVRIMVTGEPPTADYGVPMDELQAETFTRLEAFQLRMIRSGANNGLVRLTYYAQGGA